MALVGQVGREKDVGYAEYGIFPAYDLVVALDLPMVACWQHACCDAVAAYSIAGYG